MIASAQKCLRGATIVVLLAVFCTGVFPPAIAQAVVVPTESSSGIGTALSTAKSLVDSIVQTSKAFAMHFKEFIGDSLANIVAKAALRSITQSTVNWINNGFKGSPSFVTNPEGFLLDVADQVAGQTIEELAPLLCAPFRIDIRAALGLNLSFNAAHDVRCRLTDVIRNMESSYDTFVAGNFGAGGWNSWINIAGVQQNNPYGAYLQTADAASIRITSATQGEVKRLDFGRGFLDYRECEVPGEPIVATNFDGSPRAAKRRQPTQAEIDFRRAQGGMSEGEIHAPVVEGYITRAGPCKKKGPIKTPGSVIEGQLQSALGIDLQGLAFADEINEIFAALVNQLMKQVFTSGGLAGAKSYKSSSFDDGLPASDDTTVNGYIGQLNTIKTRAQQERTSVEGVAFKGELGANTQLGQNVNNTVVADINNKAGAGAGGVNGNQESETKNIALGKFATQSSNCTKFAKVYPQNPFASVAVDDNLSGGDGYYPAFSCTNGSTNQGGNTEWWQVDLETYKGAKVRGEAVTEITEIVIYRPSGPWEGNNTYDSTLRNGNFIVSILGDTGQNVYSVPIRSRTSSSIAPAYAYNSPIYTIPVPAGTKGRYVKVSQNGPAGTSVPLLIVEVQVFGKQTALNAGGGIPLALKVTAGGTGTETTLPEPGAGDTITPTISITANNTVEGAYIRIAFQSFDATNNAYQTIPFSNHFTSFKVAIPGKRIATEDFIGINAAGEREMNAANLKQIYSGNTLESPTSPIVVAPNIAFAKDVPITLTFTGVLASSLPGNSRFRIVTEIVKDGVALSTSYIGFSPEN